MREGPEHDKEMPPVLKVSRERIKLGGVLGAGRPYCILETIALAGVLAAAAVPEI